MVSQLKNENATTTCMIFLEEVNVENTACALGDVASKRFLSTKLTPHSVNKLTILRLWVVLNLPDCMVG